MQETPLRVRLTWILLVKFSSVLCLDTSLNWYPMVSGNSPLMDTGHFFGLDRTSLVSKEEDLGASYIQFPCPLHMFAHMLQTGNTSAMFLYIMYLEVQLHSKIGKWVTKPMCKWEDSVP